VTALTGSGTGEKRRVRKRPEKNGRKTGKTGKTGKNGKNGNMKKTAGRQLKTAAPAVFCSRGLRRTCSCWHTVPAYQASKKYGLAA
jgi:hypothetical protein